MAAVGNDDTFFLYKAPWPLYALGWSHRLENTFRLSIGSFIEEYRNKLYQYIKSKPLNRPSKSSSIQQNTPTQRRTAGLASMRIRYDLQWPR